jgi:vacuolar-type H+-ATPase subunit I/STV1
LINFWYAIFKTINSAATLELGSNSDVIESEIQIFDQFCEKFNIQELVPNQDFIEKLSSRRKKRNEVKKEKLNFKQKIEIVNKIIDETNKNIVAVQNENEIKIESFNSQFEQLDEQYKGNKKKNLSSPNPCRHVLLY